MNIKSFFRWPMMMALVFFLFTGLGGILPIEKLPTKIIASPSTDTYPFPLRVSQINPNVSFWANHSFAGLGQALVVAADGLRMYTGNFSGVWRSNDGGYTFQQMTRPQPAPDSFAVPGALKATSVFDLAVSPINRDLVLSWALDEARDSTHDVDGIYRSIDGGQTWSYVHEFSCSNNNQAGELVFSPDDPNLVYATGGCAIAISTDAGANWNESPVTDGINNGTIWTMAVGPSEPNPNPMAEEPIRRVYGAGNNTIWVSLDGGQTWTRDQGMFLGTGQRGFLDPGFGGSASEKVGYSAHTLVIEPGNTKRIILAANGLANGTSFYHPGSSGPDGVRCNNPHVIDQNSNNIFDAGESYVSGGFAQTGAALLSDAKVKYFDANSNLIWDSGDSIVYDDNTDNLYTKDEPVLAGGTPNVGSPLRTNSQFKYVNLGVPYGARKCGEGSLWLGDFSNFDSTTNPSAVWAQLPGPPVYYGVTSPSGNLIVKTKTTPNGYLLIFSDRNHVHVSAGLPTSFASWHRLDGCDASKNQKNDCGTPSPGVGYGGNWIYMHADPHAIAFTPDFNITLQPASGVSFPYNQNSELCTPPQCQPSGKLWFLNDGGVYMSADGGASSQSWRQSLGLYTLQPINLAGVADGGGRPGLYFGVGDNDDFFTRDGGTNWGNPWTECGDCDAWFSDPAQPDRLVSLIPRNGGGFAIYKGSNGYPDASQEPVRAPCPNNCKATSSEVLRGYRPLIQTLDSDGNPPPDGDILVIRFTSGGNFLLRTQNISNINQPSDWGNTSLAQQVGPMLPAGADIVQASGGHLSPTFYVGDSIHLWRLAPGETNWTQIVPKTNANAALRFFSDTYNPNLIYIVDNNGIKRSNDSGQTWSTDTALDNLLKEEDYAYNARGGLIRDMIFDRFERSTRFAFANSGVFYTLDGNRWMRLESALATPSRPLSGYFDSISNVCNRALYVAYDGRSVQRFSPIPRPWGVQDLNNLTGGVITSQVAAWTTLDQGLTVEHVAGLAANNDLLVYFWKPGINWTPVNVSAITGRKAVTPPVAWVINESGVTVERLASTDSNGNVLVFTFRPGQSWSVTDVSSLTGGTVAANLAAWQTPDGANTVSHLAGMALNGDLLTFYSQPGGGWGMVNISNATGIKVGGNPTAWLSNDGPALVEHLAVPANNGDVLVFYWKPGINWTAVNVTGITGDSASGMTSWVTSDNGRQIEHLAGRSLNGDVIVFYFTPGQSWRVVNVTQRTGYSVIGSLTSWQTANCGGINVEHIAGRTADGNLILFYWSPRMDWRAMNLTALTNLSVSSDIAAWQAPNGANTTEHLAAIDPAGKLLNLFSDDSAPGVFIPGIFQPPQVTSVTTLGGELTDPDGSVQVTFQPGSVDDTLLVSYRFLDHATHPLPAGAQELLHFSLETTSLPTHSEEYIDYKFYQSPVLSVNNLNQPYTLNVRYPHSHLLELGLIGSHVHLLVWDGVSWVDALPCTGCSHDIGNQLITFISDRFTEFALITWVQNLYLPIITR